MAALVNAEAGKVWIGIDTADGLLKTKDENGVITAFTTNVIKEGEWRYYLPAGNVNVTEDGTIREGLVNGNYTKQIREGGACVDLSGQD